VTPETEVVKSHAPANEALVGAFERFFMARGNTPRTLRSYNETLARLIEFLGSRSLVEVDRPTCRAFLGSFFSRGLSASTIERHAAALRAFFKFVKLNELIQYDPTLLLPHRKLPRRLPVVLTVEEVERLIDAAEDPFEAAVAEVLYSTGVRVSELINLRLEDIQWESNGSHLSSIRVHRGKGGKDRVVLFGRKAANAIRAYQRARPSTTGFLFEAPARNGSLYRRGSRWIGSFYVDKVQREIPLLGTLRNGHVPEKPTRQQARRELDRITSKVPGFHPVSARSYTPEAIRNVLKRLAWRAGLKHVHPHALRRAFASHLLQGGADLRVLQDLLGHTNVTTTMLYTHLTAENLKAVHERTHPHEGGQGNAEKNGSRIRRNRSAQSR